MSYHHSKLLWPPFMCIISYAKNLRQICMWIANTRIRLVWITTCGF